MIFLVQFGINKHLKIFQRPQIALALRARAILLVFEKFTRAYSFQIALEIMWLSIQTTTTKTVINRTEWSSYRSFLCVCFTANL